MQDLASFIPLFLHGDALALYLEMSNEDQVGQRDDTVPHRSVFNYEWRHPRDTSQEIDEQGPARIQIGEEVWVKPPNARCTMQWERGVITDVQSPNNLSVDGMPRHILDLRRVVHVDDDKCWARGQWRWTSGSAKTAERTCCANLGTGLCTVKWSLMIMGACGLKSNGIYYSHCVCVWPSGKEKNRGMWVCGLLICE